MTTIIQAIQDAITTLTYFRSAFAPIITAFPLSGEQSERIDRINSTIVLPPSPDMVGLDAMLSALEGAKYFTIAVEKLFVLSAAQSSAHDAVRESWRTACYNLWKT